MTIRRHLSYELWECLNSMDVLISFWCVVGVLISLGFMSKHDTKRDSYVTVLAISFCDRKFRRASVSNYWISCVKHPSEIVLLPSVSEVFIYISKANIVSFNLYVPRVYRWVGCLYKENINRTMLMTVTGLTLTLLKIEKAYKIQDYL